MGLAARRLLRDAWHSLGVVAVVGTIAFGLPAIDRAVPANRSVPLDRPYRVGGGIALVPPAGDGSSGCAPNHSSAAGRPSASTPSMRGITVGDPQS